MLSVAAIRARAIPLHGVAFIGEVNTESEGIIAELGQVKRMGRLPPVKQMPRENLSDVFAANFRPEDFA